jgi:hypothetical protein
MQRNAILCALAILVAGSALAQPPGGNPPPGTPTGGPPGGPPGGGMAMKTSADIQYDVVVDVTDGQPAAGAIGKLTGKLSATQSTGLKLRAGEPHGGGLYVHGHAPFTLANSQIDLAGGGLSDFDGIAAGALVRDDATLTLRDVHITTNGIVSSAAVATDKTTLKVWHSTLRANGGAAPSGYVRRIGPGMMEPPTPLGIVGTARAALVMGEAKAYFYDSSIIAEGWGALSTDAAHGAYLEANRCDIQVHRSGYGTYADNGATVVINDSRMHVATFAGIIAGTASIALNNDRIVSEGNAVMIHSVMGTPADLGKLTIKGGEIRSTNAAILVKSANAEILIDGTKIIPGNGDLLLGVRNDDNNATKVGDAKVAGIHAVVRHTALQGNLVHLDTERAMAVDLESASLKGAVRGAILSLDATSRWTATADSQLTLAGHVDTAHIDAPAGITIHAKTGSSDATRGHVALQSGGSLDIE